MSLKLGFIRCLFSWLYWGYVFWGKTQQKWSVLIMWYVILCYQYDLLLVMFPLITWPKQCWPGSPLFLPFLYFVLWKQVTKSSLHLVWGMGACWALPSRGRVSAHIIWNSCEKKIFLFFSLYSIIYLFQCGLKYIYFLLWVMIKPGLFILLLKLFHLSPLGDWLMSSFDVFPSFCFLELFLTFWHCKVLWTHRLFSLPTPRISHLSQDPYFLSLENGI